MTELALVQDDLRRLVAAGEITLSDLLERLAAPAPEEQAAKPKPKSVVLSQADKRTLRTLPAQLADLNLPDYPRVLTEVERKVLVPLFDQVKAAKAAVTKAEEALKEAMHGHIDATTDGPLDKNGHKLTEGEVSTPDYDRKVTRGLVGGKSVTLTDDDLKDLETGGAISHAQYLRMTKSVPVTRVPVPDAIMAEIAKSPDLLFAFAAKATRAPRSTAIRMATN